eukprot:106690_1
MKAIALSVLFIFAQSQETVFPDNAELKDPPTSDGQFINSGTPGGVPVSFDCAAREYAWSYGQQIQPHHGNFVELFDALQLSACNVSRPIPNKRIHQILQKIKWFN